MSEPAAPAAPEEHGVAVVGMDLGAVSLLSFQDGRPGTWAAFRLADGIAFCTAALPADFPAVLPMPALVRDRLLAWATAKERLWILVSDEHPEWACSRWRPGHGAPETYDAVEALTGDFGEVVLDLLGAVLQIACEVFPKWDGFQIKGPVKVTVLPVFQMEGVGEEEA